jgi:pimeloyl-ACP methyl ester carboxylesterase
MLQLIKIYFKSLSYFFPALAARQAFELFQRTRPFSRRFRKREMSFYKKARKFNVPGIPENTPAYELGNPKGDLVILVHGWDSNAGSMGRIADFLAGEGKRVIALDLPAHGNSKMKKANIYLCKESLRSLVHFLNPDHPFDLVTHSFGSAVAAFAFWASTYRISHWVMLSSPNRMRDIFLEFKTTICLGNRAYRHLENKGNLILNERISDLSVANWIKEIKVEKLMIIHDKFDRILPYSNSEAIQNENPVADLKPLEEIGHYRMLNSPEVMGLIKNQIMGKSDFSKRIRPKASNCHLQPEIV